MSTMKNSNEKKKKKKKKKKQHAELCLYGILSIKSQPRQDFLWVLGGFV